MTAAITRLELVEPAPVFTIEAGSSWANLGVIVGGAATAEGRLYLLYSGLNHEDGTASAIGLAQSEDGVHWQRVGSEPVLRSADAPVAAATLLATSLLQLNEDLWAAYFVIFPAADPERKGELWRATAPALTGPWRFDTAPALVAGRPNSWEASGIIDANVFIAAGEYVMYYTAFGGQTLQIGRATSRDGQHWTRYNDPNTTYQPNADSDPVLTPGRSLAGWDARGVYGANVWRTATGGWQMVFLGVANDPNQPAALGLAESRDGLSWYLLDGPPAFSADTFAGGPDFPGTTLVTFDEQIFLYVTIGTTAALTPDQVGLNWNIYLFQGRP